MDKLMKQAEDHLSKGRVQIATDEAIHGIKNIAADQSGASEVSLSQVSTEQWWFQELNGISGANIITEDQYRGINIARQIIPRLIAALSSNAAQSAGQEPVEIDLMTGDVLYVNSYRITPQEMPIGARIIKTWKIDPKELRAAIPDLFGSHPSSAAQDEEIRNAALDDLDRLRTLAEDSDGCQYGTLSTTTVRDLIANAERALKTAAPSKGGE